MRLVHYINEGKASIIDIDDPDKAIKILKKNCSNYLKETKGKWFYRGVREILGDYDLGYKLIRKNRRPRGMREDIFIGFNKWLKKSGHVRRDQSISVTSDEDHASSFATSTVCFIEGNYDYTWVKARDINQSDYRSNNDWYGFINADYISIIEKLNHNIVGPSFIQKKYININKLGLNFFYQKMDEIKKWILKEYPKFFTTNKGMQNAYKKNYEIWFKAKGYYFVKYNSELHKYLEKFL